MKISSVPIQCVTYRNSNVFIQKPLMYRVNQHNKGLRMPGRN